MHQKSRTRSHGNPEAAARDARPARPALAAVAAAVALLSGCATTEPAGVAPAAAAAAQAAPAPVATAAAAPGTAASAPAGARPPVTAGARPPGAAPAPPPFADVIKEAKREDGFIPIWRKDEKVWIELAPDRLGKPFLLSVNIKNAVGERGLYAGAMGPAWLAQFRKVGNQVQLVALQTGFRGDGDPGNKITVRESFSDSLVGSSAAASAEHPERKSVLVDASFLLGDMAGYSTWLEMAFRMPFAPDRANSFFDAARAEPGLTTLGGQVHYSVPRISAPPLLPPGAPRPPLPPPPQVTPDARSLFVGFVYNFRELPAEPMKPRLADPRVGYFVDSYTDLSDDLKVNPRVHLINRWRLEKKDPAAAMSEPVKPITFWMDRNTPLRYRKTVEEGILEWNKAFERAGFKNAIVAKQQPDDASFSLLEAGHASVRWFTGADVGYAAGPSHSDPRTGEILDADIVMSDVFGRGLRRFIREDVASTQSFAAPPSAGAPAWRQQLSALWQQGMADQDDAPQACRYGLQAATAMHFALDMLEARGDLDPDSPEAEAFVQAAVKDVIVHEVGHTLGLRHNFLSSTTVTRAQLKDKAFGESRSISNSVMDYNNYNLPLQGEPKGQLYMRGLGAYDLFAIEYGYKPLDPQLDAKAEAVELDRIASRQRDDPLLAFADDGDAYDTASGLANVDPRVNLFDQGDDPLAFYQRQFQLSRELWARLQVRGAKPGDDTNRLRRGLMSGFNQLRTVPADAAKYVGGLYVERDPQGRPGSRPAFKPVEPARQREALNMLAESVFSTTSFRFKPEFLTSLQPDFIVWNRQGPVDIPRAVLALQTQALDRLLAAGTAQRLLDLPNLVPEAERKGLISLNELYGTLQAAVWSELKSGKDIEPMRRSLQRAHLTRLQGLLTRPGGALPADAYALARFQAVRLQADIKAAAGRRGLSVENRAHLEEALNTLTEALRATIVRS